MLLAVQFKKKPHQNRTEGLYYHLYAVSAALRKTTKNTSVVTRCTEDYPFLHPLEMMEVMFQHQESSHKGYKAVSAISVERYEKSAGTHLILQYSP